MNSVLITIPHENEITFDFYYNGESVISYPFGVNPSETCSYIAHEFSADNNTAREWIYIRLLL